MAAGKTTRPVPQERAMKRVMDREVPVDTTGMDPEMAATLRQDQGRRMKMKMIGQPGAVAAQKAGGFMDKLRGMFAKKPAKK